jgi:hypothetical protein
MLDPESKRQVNTPPMLPRQARCPRIWDVPVLAGSWGLYHSYLAVAGAALLEVSHPCRRPRGGARY